MSVRIPAGAARLFRLPGEPEPPPGDITALRVFRAGSGYLRYKLVLWAIPQAIAFVFALGFTGIGVSEWVGRVTAGTGDPSAPLWLALVFGAPVWILYLAQLVLSFFAVRLDYDLRWYMLGEDALRIREGILSVKERTMSYANIQQVSVRRGPLQSLLGIGDVEVRSAGGGAATHGQADEHQGFFRGVANPEEISDLIRSRVERHRGAGLGDDEARSSRGAPASDSALVTARALAEEIRGLRLDLARPPSD